MRKFLLFFILTIGSQHFVKAQDFETSINTDDLNLKKYAKDTSAHALFLNEYGKARIDVVSDDRVRLLFDYHACIKIFDSKGLEHGTIEIPLYNSSDGEASEEVDNVTGTTYYIDDNGLMRSAPFDIKKIYTVKDNKNHRTVKLALPALRAGCVIEYRYRVISPYLDYFHNWNFQDDVPKEHSRYEVHIPGFWTFNAMIRGSLKLSNTSAQLEKECFSSHGSKSDCSFMMYEMKDIPAFIEEDYMTSAKNFVSAIYFDEVEWTQPYTGVKTVVSKSWKDVDYQLKTSEYFGSQLKRKDLMKDRIAAVIAGKTDTLEKAKAIYSYLQKWYKWNDYIGYSSIDGIKKSYESHSGSIADINLALGAALKAANINTDAVLLSTRNNGNINTLYPVLNDFNYVIIKVNIGNKDYLLDATDPLLSFGLLPLKCLNDKGRVISLDKPSYWIELSGLQKESTTRALDLTLLDNGKLKGTLTNYYSGYNAYLKRKAIKSFNSVDEYVENFDEKLTKLKVLKSSIINLDSLDMPLGESYEVEIDAFDNLKHDRLAFNPFLWDKITKNPFKLAERDYPVDWGMASDERLILTMHLPAQYTVENPPDAVAFKMPNNGGMYVSSYDNIENTFTLSNLTKFSKAIYSPEEYPYLKELYNKIILTEKADLVFKKK